MDVRDYHGQLDLSRLSHVLPSFSYLSDSGIREALRQGALSVSPLHDKAIQPASLDVCIKSARVYDAHAHERMSAAQGGGPLGIATDGLASRLATRYPVVGGDQILLPPRTYSEVFLEERIDHLPAFDVIATLRSSRGRLGLRLNGPHLIHDDAEAHDPAFPDEQGPYLGVWNFNANPIILHTHTPFAQLFFLPRTPRWDAYCGKTVTDPARVATIARTLSHDLETIGPYVLFRIGDRSWSYRDFGAIDTATKTPPEAIQENKLVQTLLEVQEASVVTLDPRLTVPPNIGIRLLQNLPYVQRPGPIRINAGTGLEEMLPDQSVLDLEPFVVNGEWVDPGYQGNITAHPIPLNDSRVIARGDPFCVGILIEYPAQVERAYGDATLGSHYQGSKGDVARS